MQQKKYSLASGSGIIQEELRKVRLQATEDMLKTMKIDLSSFALEPKSIQNSFLADKTELGGEDKVHALNFLPATKSIDASMVLVAGVSTCHGFPASVLEVTQDDSCNEDLTSIAVNFSSAQHQLYVATDLAAIQTVEGEEHAISKSRHPTIPDLALEHDSRLSDRTCSTGKVAELRPEPSANGFFYSGSSLSAGDIEQNPRSSDDKNANPVISSYDNLSNSAPVEETCELLSEASIEVPIVNETDSIASGSHNSSSMKLTQLDLKHGFTGKTSNRVEKRQGRKPSRYNKKSEARVR